MSYSARRPEHRSTRCFANRNYARTTPPPPAPAAPTAARSPVAGGVRPGQPPAAPPPAVPSRPSPAQPSRRAHPRAQPSRRCHRPAAPSRPHPQPDQPPVAPRPTAGPGADHRQTPTYHARCAVTRPICPGSGVPTGSKSSSHHNPAHRLTASRRPTGVYLEGGCEAAGYRRRTTLHPRCAVRRLFTPDAWPGGERPIWDELAAMDGG